MLSLRFASLLALLVVCGAARSAQHPYSVEDHLKLEDTGGAVVDPTGRWLVYERMPPYNRRADYSVGRIATSDSGGGWLMLVDLASASLRPRLLFTPDSQSTYWIDGFSPDGKHLAFYFSRQGRVALGTYTFENERLTTFSPPPRVDWIHGHTSVWTPDGRVIYAAVAENQQPAALSLRRYSADRYIEEWQKTWEGKEPAVSIVSSHRDRAPDDFLEGRLILADPSSEQFAVIGDGAYEDVQVSADGRYLAALRTTRQVQPDPTQLAQDWSVGRSILYLWDLTSHDPPQVIRPDMNVFPGSLAWAPGGGRLAFFAWNDGEGVRSGIFHAVEARSGRVFTYPHRGLDLASERERGYIQRPERAVWLGELLAVVARLTENPLTTPRFTYRDLGSRTSRQLDKADWFLLDRSGTSRSLTAQFNSVSAVPVTATHEALFVLADGHVWKLEAERAPVDLTKDEKLDLVQPRSVIDTTKRPPFTTSVVFENESSSASEFVVVDLKESSVWSAKSPARESALLAATSRALLFREDTPDGANVILARADGRPVVLENLNAHLKQVAKPTWTTIKYALASGQQLEGCVLLPADYERGKRYPAIVEVYPGRLNPESGPMCLNPGARHFYSLGAKPGAYSLHLLAGQGYIVMMPATPSDLIRTPQGPIAGINELVQKGTDALVEQGYADPDRIGLFGMSQGAFAALWIATQTGRFKAVVSMNGWADMWSHYFQGASAFTRFYADEFPYIGEALRYESTAGSDYGLGRTPWDDPSAYIQNSPVSFARQITNPIMLIHSDMDGFPISQYDQMFTALYRQRKEAQFVRYWGEGHGPSSPANITDMWQRIVAWYDEHLGNN